MGRILVLIALGAAAVYYIYEIRKETPSEVAVQEAAPSFEELITADSTMEERIAYVKEYDFSPAGMSFSWKRPPGEVL